MKEQKITTQQLVVSAVMIALAAILSMIKVWAMPLGGSVTLLSMLPIVIISIRYGVKWGFVTSFLYAIVQIFMNLGVMMSWGMTPAIWIGCLVFDYLVAYGILGIAGLFRDRGVIGACAGITLALVLRFVSHFISGSIFFDVWCPEGWNVYWYSICYNGTYMLPELIFTLVASILLFQLPAWKKIADISK